MHKDSECSGETVQNCRLIPASQCDKCQTLIMVKSSSFSEIVIVPRRVKDSFRKSVTDVMRAIEGLIAQTKGICIPFILTI